MQNPPMHKSELGVAVLMQASPSGNFDGLHDPITYFSSVPQILLQSPQFCESVSSCFCMPLQQLSSGQFSLAAQILSPQIDSGTLHSPNIQEFPVTQTRPQVKQFCELVSKSLVSPLQQLSI